MIIDFSQLIHGEKQYISFDQQANEEQISYKGEKIVFNMPVRVVGEAYLEEQILVLTGNVKSKIELKCGRCLEKFIYTLDFPFEEEIEINNGDSAIMENERVDFSNILWENIILNLPIKAICNEECKGLCPTCGENQNLESCNCEKEDIDPRLALLKDLFDQK